MKSYPNIEKSGFRRGEYVGYGGGRVYRIRKTGFRSGKWVAFLVQQTTDSRRLYADTLQQMSVRLTKEG